MIEPIPQNLDFLRMPFDIYGNGFKKSSMQAQMVGQLIQSQPFPDVDIKHVLVSNTHLKIFTLEVLCSG